MAKTSSEINTGLFGLDELATIICLQRPPNKLLESCYCDRLSGNNTLQESADARRHADHVWTRRGPGHSTGNCLVSREGCTVRTQRPGEGGLYLERLDAKLHEDCNNRDRGPQEGSTQADLSIIIITSLE